MTSKPLANTVAKTGMNTLGYYVILCVVVLLVALAGYQWLPDLGIEIMANLVTPKVLGALIVLGVGALFYKHYLNLCYRHSTLYMLAYLALLPWLTWFNKLMVAKGINFPQSVCLGVLLCIPTFLMVIKYWRPMLQQVAPLRYYTLFWVIVVINFIFFDHPIHDSTVAVGKQTISVHYLTSMTLALSSLFLTAYAGYREPDPRRLLDLATKTIMGMTLALSVVCIICYPLHIMTISSEGTTRMQMIFFHPNHFAMYQSYLLIFLSGMYLYNMANQPDTPLQKLLGITIGLGFVAMLTTVSKNAIASYIVATTVMALLSMGVSRNKMLILLFLGLAPVVLFGLILLFDTISGAGIIEKISNRLSDSSSLEWRFKTWGYLLGDIDFSNFWFGHGLSAASERMFAFQPPGKGNIFKVLEVHNDYLQVLYDFGLAGLSIYLWFIATWLQKVIGLVRVSLHSAVRSLNVIVVGMITAFLICSSTDNNIAMLETPFWMSFMILCVVISRLQRETTGTQPSASVSHAGV